MPNTKGGPYGGQADGGSSDIQKYADKFLAAIESHVEAGRPLLTPAEERDVGLAEATLTVIRAGLRLQPSPITVTGLSRAEGSAGTEVTISGTNFTPAAPVRFGSAQVTRAEVLSATEIAATVPPPPAGDRTVPVTVGASTSSCQFTYSQADTKTAT